MIALGAVAAPLYAQVQARTDSIETSVATIPALDGALISTLVFPAKLGGLDSTIARARAAVWRFDSLAAASDSNADVARVNRAAGGAAAVRVAPSIVDLVQTTRLAWSLSDGRLDPTAAPLTRAWEVRETRGLVPSSGQLDSMRALVGLSRVEIDTERMTLRLPRAGMQIDLGLAARGAGFDLARRVLGSGGVLGGVIQNGASALAFGRPPRRGPWRIAIVPPDMNGRIAGVAVLDSGAVMLAADGERARPDPMHPVRLIDARTGEPPRGASSVFVIAPTAERATLLAAALFMLPPERAVFVADSLGIAAVVVRSPARGGEPGPADVAFSAAARRVIEPANLDSKAKGP